MFREENRVHVVHGDDGWEESDEAWELGEEEMMIVGTVQQEEDCTWQDACSAWRRQDGEMTADVYQARVCQGMAELAATGQCKGADVSEESEEVSGPGGLLLEGEEQEYFLELLMRRASPERHAASLPMESKTTLGKSKKGKNKGKKACGKNPAGEAASKEVKEKKTINAANSSGKQPAPDTAGPRHCQQPGNQGQRIGGERPAETGASDEDERELRRGVFRTEDAGLFLRSL